MEALLPLLQMRAHLLQQGPEAAGNRDRYASTASSGRPSMSSSSDPSSPTTPVSPPISLSSHLHLINSWKDQDPYHHHLSQQHFSAINSSNNQLYLSQLAAINLQLQQRRLLSSGDYLMGRSSPPPQPAAPPDGHLVATNAGPDGQSRTVAAQEEPMDLSRAGSSGRLDSVEANVGGGSQLTSPSMLSSSSLSSSALSIASSATTSPSCTQRNAAAASYDYGCGNNSSPETTTLSLGQQPVSCSDPTVEASGRRKRSRSSTSYEELKFTESEDDEVFETTPAFPSPPPALAVPSSVYRPFESTTANCQQKQQPAAAKKRHSVPAPLHLLPPSNAALSAAAAHHHHHSLSSGAAFHSPLFSPLWNSHHHHSPFLPPLLDPSSPFTPTSSSAFHSPIFRFPPVGLPAPLPHYPSSPFYHNNFTFSSALPPPTSQPSSDQSRRPRHSSLMSGAHQSSAAALSGGGSSNVSESEARRLFLARLHSTVLKLERREEDEDQQQQLQQPAGQRGTGQLAGYQVPVVTRNKMFLL